MKFYQPNNNPGPGAHYIENMPSRSSAFTIGRGPRTSQGGKSYTDQYYDISNIYQGPKIG